MPPILDDWRTDEGRRKAVQNRLQDVIELRELMEDAHERFGTLSPERRRGWAVNEMLLAHPEMTREYIEKIYDWLEK